MQSYIYAHINPLTSEVLCIGQGRGYRCWDSKGRSDPHLTFMENLQRQGYAPTQWGVILIASITGEEAREIEHLLIKQIKPAFNQQGICAANAGRGEANKLSVLTEEKVRLMRATFEAGGVSLRAIGRRYGISYSTARKAVTGLGWSHVQ